MLPVVVGTGIFRVRGADIGAVFDAGDVGRVGLDEKGVLAFGWVGKEDIDETCAHEANLGLIQAELLTNTHILKIFFHEKETSDTKKQKEIAIDRTKKHALNAIALLEGKERLKSNAGKGKRQGYKDTGEL